MSTTVMVHLDLSSARPSTVHTDDASDGPYVWAGLNKQVQLCVRSRAEADELIALAVDIEHMLAEAEQSAPAEAAQAPPPTCLTCGAAVDLDPVHVKATTGTAARTEHYCHDVTACHNRRHPALPGMIAALDGLTRQATP